MMRVEYRVTRPEDFIRFGLHLAPKARGVGWTAWAGRRAVGLGGVIVAEDGTGWGHFAATPDYRHVVLRCLHRRTLKLLRRLTRAGVKHIRAVCDMSVPRAAEWMTRLGFMPTTETFEGAVIHERSV